MKIRRPWFHPLLDEIRQTPIGRLQGGINSKYLLLAPVPKATELSHKLCWCDERAVWFFDNMAAIMGLKPDDFIIVPTTFDGKKPVKANTELGKRIVAAAAASETVTHMLCIGSDAFKVFFGFGAKPPMGVLAGQLLKTRESGFKPLITFPDSERLYFDANARYEPKREFYIARELCQKTQKAYLTILNRLPQFFTSKKI